MVSQRVKVDEKTCQYRKSCLHEFSCFTDNKKGRVCDVVTNDSGKG